MGGGHFDYKQSVLGDISNELDMLVEQLHKKCFEEESCLKWIIENPDDDKSLEEIYLRFELGKLFIDIVYDIVYDIDWFLSGDTGEETFKERFDNHIIDLLDLEDTKIECILRKLRNGNF